VKVHGPPKLVDARPDFPFIVVSPQCPKGRSWNGEVQQQFLAELLDSVMTRFAVDRERVVVTGLSMGGFGSWSLTALHPGRFAAAVPICGGGTPANADKLKTVPFWVFHGAKDKGVPLKLSEEMVEAVQKAGGQAKLTVYPDAEHDSWTETYKNEAVYDWLLAQRRTCPAPLPTADPCIVFARIGSVDLKLGNPDDKNTFAASLYLKTSPACGPALRERVAPVRDKLVNDFTAWVNSQPPEQLVGNAGREQARTAVKELCDKTLFNGQPTFVTEVVFDQYFVRHKGMLKLETK
jgi:predicted esterase/flagellar basal body-associated protein FliL